LGTSHSAYLGYASSLVQPSCHRGRGIGAAGFDKGVPDPAQDRARIRLVMTGAEVGDSDLAYSVIEAALPPSADLLSTNRRGSGSG
jgi:hypothetical protein